MPHIQFLPPEPVVLVSRVADDPDPAGPGLHVAKVAVGDCTIVDARTPCAPLQGRFAVWTVALQLHSPDTPRSLTLRKRYSDFVRFRERLLLCLPPPLRRAVPPLPPPVPWYDAWRYSDVNLDRAWLAARRAGLERFLQQVLLNRALVAAASVVVRGFLEPPAAHRWVPVRA
ncbi:FACL108Cp [Eremothecium gossypii FDAG1]|nr:FACL108Cp [Eremothecium gossypii FDAG1]